MLHYHWGQTAAKKGTWPLLTAHVKHESSVNLTRTTAGWFTQLFLNLVNLRDLFGIGTKAGRKYIQQIQPNQFYFYNQNIGFFKIMDQNVAKYKIGIRIKK